MLAFSKHCLSAFLALADDVVHPQRFRCAPDVGKPSALRSAGAARPAAHASSSGAARVRAMALRRALLAAALAAAAAEVNVSCQIFEETMICDNAAQGVVRGEIRTCSG